MIFHAKSKTRAFHLGHYPLEALERDCAAECSDLPPFKKPTDQPAPVTNSLAAIAHKYADIYLADRTPKVAAAKAPVPDDLGRRAVDVKGFCYFMDAEHAGIAELQAVACSTITQQHSHAVVILAAPGKLAPASELISHWLDSASAEALANMRASAIALGLARYIATLGFSATAHAHGQTDIDLERLAVQSGVAYSRDNQLNSPFLGSDIVIAAVTTDYPLATDAPLAKQERADQSRDYWRGINGAMSGKERHRRQQRALHMSHYPIEQLKRVERPTTLIFDDEVPRLPKRADGFNRARAGDFGNKAKAELAAGRMTKSPYDSALFGSLIPLMEHQDGEVSRQQDPRFSDPQANTQAIKSLLYHLGADQVGICEIPDYAWYSHDASGEPITPYSRYAICILIDQGHDTMEGASGDDWISASQSGRAYACGGELTGVVADFIRTMGYPARSQTAVDGDVLQIPLLLLAGLGELSRIGEMVLNPFVGPRFKSAVITTDLPLAVDKPIDFGLQDYCGNCAKCARECPVSAIPFGDKVMFNGYEIWKPDVQRCIGYRVTNPKGSMCGRCMKTCPLNQLVDSDGPIVASAGAWLNIHTPWLTSAIAPLAQKLDDKLENGTINPVKKWWLDLELVDGVCVAPAKGTHMRGLNLDNEKKADSQVIAYYPASTMPAADTAGAHIADRKAGIAIATELENPRSAKARKARNDRPPGHYIPIKPVG